MEQTWLGKAEARGLKVGRAEGIEKGIEKGIKKGIKKGRTEGVREGKAQAVDQMRQVVLRRLEQRFGAVPERVQAKVRRMKTVEPLAEMLEKLALVQSADDLLSRRRSLPES